MSDFKRAREMDRHNDKLDRDAVEREYATTVAPDVLEAVESLKELAGDLEELAREGDFGHTLDPVRLPLLKAAEAVQGALDFYEQFAKLARLRYESDPDPRIYAGPVGPYDQGAERIQQPVE